MNGEKKTERVNFVLSKDLRDFLLDMVEKGEAMSLSDAIRKCIIHYKAQREVRK